MNYENLCEKLRVVRDQVAEDTKQLEEGHERLKRDGVKFTEYLQRITYKINQKFESFMCQMNPTYRGRIARTGGETFEYYGLNLEVRFREGDPFRPLALGYQSGMRALISKHPRNQ